MADRDVVAELNEWLKYSNAETADDVDLIARSRVQRARDEIMALRAERDETGRFVDRVKYHMAEARTDALEEAARYCEQVWEDRDITSHSALDCAAHIRTLKQEKAG